MASEQKADQSYDKLGSWKHGPNTWRRAQKNYSRIFVKFKLIVAQKELVVFQNKTDSKLELLL